MKKILEGNSEGYTDYLQIIKRSLLFTPPDMASDALNVYLDFLRDEYQKSGQETYDNPSGINQLYEHYRKVLLSVDDEDGSDYYLSDILKVYSMAKLNKGELDALRANVKSDIKVSYAEFHS